MDSTENVINAQNEGHLDNHDYEKGSPHLRHARLRGQVEDRLRQLVADAIARTGGCRVLEIGAGHGTFTQVLVDAGAQVTVTEASRASADHLSETYADDDRVEVVFDETGDSVLSREESWDLAVLISVVHHIPEYLPALEAIAGRLVEGGALFTVQDPLYYPRRSRLSHVASRGTYFAWRVGQGNLARGLGSRWRRLRGVYDDTNPSDLIEYHVVRQGCDEVAIAECLGALFEDVDVFTYWSTQSPLFQRMLENTSLRSDFGVAATRRLPA
ncbi:class I SAM-dependent methyltransferase [Nocardioides sp. Root190]|uniref:class I SAM-dependent methyltransferase n=1 Tax=Nocardioides sp. Root190 TaxID=1736488 RepID=UPI000B2B741E|nr:class I SAM-dependent methyltransferase [Nocardioides sp. Root190]